jgi:hypothetical protein
VNEEVKRIRIKSADTSALIKEENALKFFFEKTKRTCSKHIVDLIAMQLLAGSNKYIGINYSIEFDSNNDVTIESHRMENADTYTFTDIGRELRAELQQINTEDCFYQVDLLAEKTLEENKRKSNWFYGGKSTITVTRNYQNIIQTVVVHDINSSTDIEVALTPQKLELIEKLDTSTSKKVIDLFSFQLIAKEKTWVGTDHSLHCFVNKAGDYWYTITKNDSIGNVKAIKNDAICTTIKRRLAGLQVKSWFFAVEQIISDVMAQTGQAEYGGRIPDMNTTELEKTYHHTLEKPVTVQRKFYGYLTIEYVQYAIVKDSYDSMPKLVEYYEPAS